MQFDYFYGSEAEQFTFYRIPKILITSQFFKKVSDSAKLLYGLMLDRMSLSIVMVGSMMTTEHIFSLLRMMLWSKCVAELKKPQKCLQSLTVKKVSVLLKE